MESFEILEVFRVVLGSAQGGGSVEVAGLPRHWEVYGTWLLALGSFPSNLSCFGMIRRHTPY